VQTMSELVVEILGQGYVSIVALYARS
jgi:hypothetical protein